MTKQYFKPAFLAQKKHSFIAKAQIVYNYNSQDDDNSNGISNNNIDDSSSNGLGFYYFNASKSSTRIFSSLSTRTGETNVELIDPLFENSRLGLCDQLKQAKQASSLVCWIKHFNLKFQGQVLILNYGFRTGPFTRLDRGTANSSQIRLV